MKTKKIKKDKINVITLGCSKNLADSEVLMGQLSANGITVSHESEEPASIVVINTCGFIDLAKQESIDTIIQYADVKSKGGIDKLYVTGCLSQRYKDELEVEIPEVDAYFGTMELPGLLSKLNADYKHELVGEKLLTTPGHYVYMKISEGCNRTCSFCAIPLMRGKHVSKPIERLVEEARNMARIGVKELILIAQELTYYGLDLYKKRMLPELLNALCEVEGIEWVRLHYAYPNKFPLDILSTMAAQAKICNYLDIPLQHASNSVLDRMNRQTTMEEQRALIQKAREIVPEIRIRTTFLIGFPGESEEEFEDLCRFVEEMEFERVGVFQYSHEEDTSAYLMVDDVPPEVKGQRTNRIMEIQQEISFRKNQDLVGKKMKILIDRKEGEYFVGRSEFDSPEVDNEVLIDATSQYVRVGDFVHVEILNAEDYDLYAKVISE